MNQYLFEEARKLYPGTKRGNEVEYQNFSKKYRMKKDSIAPLLKPAIENQMAYREAQKKKGEWCPTWKHFSTWINGSWWTEEVPQNGKPKQEKCIICGCTETVARQDGKGGARCDKADCREKYSLL